MCHSLWDTKHDWGAAQWSHEGSTSICEKMFAKSQIFPLLVLVAVSVLEGMLLGACLALWALQMIGAHLLLRILEEAGFRVGLVTFVALGLRMVARHVRADWAALGLSLVKAHHKSPQDHEDLAHRHDRCDKCESTNKRIANGSLNQLLAAETSHVNIALYGGHLKTGGADSGRFHHRKPSYYSVA